MQFKLTRRVMRFGKNIVRLVVVSGLAGLQLASASAENLCPTVSNDGTNLVLEFTNQGLTNKVTFGYQAEQVTTSINSALEGRISSASFLLGSQAFITQLISAPTSCNDETCASIEPVEVSRYRLSSDLAIIRYPVSSSFSTTVVNFSPGQAPVVSCTAPDNNSTAENLLATLDISQATEAVGENYQSSCSGEEQCPLIFSKNVIYFSDGGGENFRGISGNDRAKALARRGLRTSGLNNRKAVLRKIILELEIFVASAQYRSGSKSFRTAVAKSLSLSKRAVTQKAGPKLVRAALVAAKGR